MTTAIDFGTDMSATDDVDPLAREVSGTTTLAQAIYRRLTTPRGALIDDPDYGFDVRELLAQGQTPAMRAAIPSRVRGEVMKDERIDDCTVDAAWPTAGELVLTVRCTSGVGPFSLVLSVTDYAATLKETT